MRKKNILNFIFILVCSFVLFFVLTLLSNKVLAFYDVTSVRFSPVLNPVLGIAFGWPAVIGCALANFVSDIISEYSPFVYWLGIVTQIIYGILPYYIWKAIIKCESHKTRLDSPKKTIYFVILMCINSLIIATFVGLFQLYTSHDSFYEAFIFAFLNDFDVSIILGLPLMAFIDYIYSHNHKIRKRHLSFNERIILISSLIQLIAFVLIGVILICVNGTISEPKVWKDIFMYSIISMNGILGLSLILMYVLAYQRKKNAGLRIIEKQNGTIYVDEKKQIEFISYPSVEWKNYIKSKEFNNSFETIRENFHPRYETAWAIMLSNQKGCPMKCTFCDCPGFGFYGNITNEEFKYQIETIIDNVGVTHTNLFVIDFMRMGEPTLNDNILKFIEFDLKETILNKVDAEVIHPTISTMLPRHNKEKVFKFVLEYCRIKNEVYDGEADIQFSINTTDENARRKMFKNMSMSLEEISELGKLMPIPKGNKYALNFAITKYTHIDPELLNKLFDKEKFSIKLTPIHQTFNAIDNGFLVTDEYDSYNSFKKIEDSFDCNGWQTRVFLDRQETDKDLLTCGNLLLPNISEQARIKSSLKKKVGLSVAIEIDAIFNMYPNYRELEAPEGFKVYYIEKEKYDIFVIKAGMGEVAAAAGVQYLVAKYGVSIIINFGVVGGLTEEMKKEKLCVVGQVVHFRYDCSEFLDLKVGQVEGYDSIFIKTNKDLIENVLKLSDKVKVVTCCSSDKFISSSKEKEYLHETFNGDICDMESSGILLVCEMNNIPCLLFKAVSDGLNDGAEGFHKELEKASMKCLKFADQIIDKISNIEK